VVLSSKEKAIVGMSQKIAVPVPHIADERSRDFTDLGTR